jgi:predicted FMN-binding regulatory protein PaiB
MPVIRVSNEAYQKILKLQAQDGNAMSIFIDRLMDRIETQKLAGQLPLPLGPKPRAPAKLKDPLAKGNPWWKCIRCGQTFVYKSGPHGADAHRAEKHPGRNCLRRIR